MIGLAVLAASCGDSRAPARVDIALQLSPCRVPDVAEEVRCGTLEVPEDRGHPERRRLVLPVVVLPSTRPEGGGVPLFELMGGPGAAATSMAPLFATQLAAMRELGDVVLVDQRGTGTGPSALVCPELDDAPPTELAGRDAIARCRSELERRADLQHYGTLDAALDLEDARRALGYDRVNLEAISYGTRLAQVYVRAFPNRVNAVVLFGALAMDVHIPGEFAENAERVLQEIIGDCDRDPRCHAAYPQLRDQLAAVAATAPPGVDRTAFTEWIRHRMYSAGGSSDVPRLIAAAARGDDSAFASSPARPGLFREAVLLSITCSEDVPEIDLAAARARAAATWFGAGRLEWQVAACEQWPRAPVAAGFHAPVASDIPVLAIAGDRDPVTPPGYAIRATARMPHAQIVRVPALGHEPDGLVGVDCVDRVELAFLRDPLRPVDATCVAATSAPAFVVEPR